MAFNALTRSIAPDILEVINDAKAATAPRKNVGEVADEKIRMRLSVSGTKLGNPDKSVEPIIAVPRWRNPGA